MSFLTGFKSAPFEMFKTTSAAASVITGDATCETLVGSKWTTCDGREFVMVQVGDTALIAGKVIQSPAVVSAYFAGLSPATVSTTGYSASYPIAASIGGKVIQIATSSTAALANQFQGGYLNVVEGTGAGQTMKIASNLAASTTSALVITLEDPFTTATSTDSRFTLTLNPYGSANGTYLYSHGVVITPATTLTGIPIGVANYPIPATTASVLSYGFIQTKGLCAVYAGGSVALGLDVGCPDDTAGQVLTYAVATLCRIGTTAVAAVDAKANMVNLQL